MEANIEQPANAIPTSEAQDPSEFLKLREECPRFRILIMGKANAGKTTILEKVCRVKHGVEPVICDKEGKQIKDKRVLRLFKPSATRGVHNIDDEITYPGSNFIFHDSRGFESGSEEELGLVHRFIAERSGEHELSLQLHAIWYCVSVEDPRSPLPKEMEFFKKGTGKVPVIVIFTKLDAQVDLSFGELRKAGRSPKDATIEAQPHAKEVVRVRANSCFAGVAHPPRARVYLQGDRSYYNLGCEPDDDVDMHKPRQECAELTEETAQAIDNAVFKHLFVSVQKNNLLLSIKYALGALLRNSEEDWDSDQLYLGLSYFAHYWDDEVYICSTDCKPGSS